ncbi:unnamed protein product [Caenorhabditis angaria]|uniref:FH2 domain-containing protein n=1 Tax=Caenorhabditis angaria TaxID=860376 RepID=A0A9P1IIF8_9PELO|nr:unnamed protein product [Caenorhabditis angaria]
MIVFLTEKNIKLKHPPFSIHVLHEAMMLASSTQPNSRSTTTNPPTTTATTGNGGDECSSSTSPTNTSASDASSMDMLTSLMNANAAAAAVVKQETNTVASPLATPPIFTPDAVTLLQFSQLFQAQQAVAQFQRQQAAQAAQAQAQAAQQHQQIQAAQQAAVQAQQATQERKRSYPCTFQYCVICQKDVHSSKLPCHIRQCHVAKPMFQCPACDFTSTYSKNNVKSHMVSLHGLAGDPISYMDKYAGQVEEFMKLCFPNVRGRGRPMQGRSSPKSPISPTQRRNIIANNSLPNGRRATMPTNDLLANLHPPTPNFHPLRNLRFNPLQSIFPTAPTLHNNTTPHQQQHNNNNNNNNNISKSVKMEESGHSEPSTSMILQPLKPGENEQPKYLDQVGVLDWSLMNELQTKNTIFEETKSNMEIYIENISRKIETTPSRIVFHLSNQLVSQVELVRSQINLQLFEVMFAIHRMDTKVLDSQLVDLLATIAPTTCDTQLLRQKTTPNNQNEEFLLGLTKIERIEEKLETMKHMNGFTKRIGTLKGRIESIGEACKMVHENKALRQVIQMIVAVLNVAFFDDRTCCAVQGFSISEIDQILRSGPEGSTQNVLNLLITILRDEISVDLDDLFGLVGILEVVENIDFDGIGRELAEIEDLTWRAEKEMEYSGSNPQLAQFIDFAKSTTKTTWEIYNSVKSKIVNLTIYLGNPVARNSNNIDPRPLFCHIINFLRQLKIAIDSEAAGSESDINILSP